MAELEIIFWYWWVASIVLLAIELLAPGFFFLWIAIAAFITGCLLLLLPATGVEIQFFVFSVLSVASIVAWRMFFKKHPTETDHPLLNKRGAQYIDRIFTLHEPIVNGQGKIKVDDTIWKVHGEDADSNSKVKVVSVKGTILVVEKI